MMSPKPSPKAMILAAAVLSFTAASAVPDENGCASLKNDTSQPECYERYLSIPDFDVDANCREQLSWVKNADINKKYVTECIQQEQNSYDVLKIYWSDLPQSRRAQAIAFAKGKASSQYYIMFQFLSADIDRSQVRNAPVPSFQR